MVFLSLEMRHEALLEGSPSVQCRFKCSSICLEYVSTRFSPPGREKLVENSIELGMQPHVGVHSIGGCREGLRYTVEAEVEVAPCTSDMQRCGRIEVVFFLSQMCPRSSSAQSWDVFDMYLMHVWWRDGSTHVRCYLQQ
jgi:hypothetical protein